MQWQWDLYKLLRHIKSMTHELERESPPVYTGGGRVLPTLNLSILIKDYCEKHPKLSHTRVNNVATHAMRKKYLETIKSIKNGEEIYSVRLIEKGERFADKDFGFISTNLLKAWYKEDGKTVIAILSALFVLTISVVCSIAAAVVKIVYIIHTN